MIRKGLEGREFSNVFCQILSLATTAAGTATGRNISGFMPNLIPLQSSFAYYTTSCVYVYLIA